jgi:hypothetical protein
MASKIKQHNDISYRQEPEWPFEEDCHDFYLISVEKGKGYNAPLDFLATRRNIDSFIANDIENQTGLAIVKNSKNPTHCQANVKEDGSVTLRALNMVNYENLHDTTWGNFTEPGHPPDIKFEGTIHLRYVLQ